MIDIGFDCCGCGVCSLKCPVSAIKMEEDKRGFIYPTIDSHVCINCGICEKSCPVENYKKGAVGDTFLARNLDSKTRFNSSSGGLFFALAQYFIGQNGIVYGAAYSNVSSVEIIRADNIESVKRIQGSKYVASDSRASFHKVLEDIDQGKLVLYSGLPCQIAALKKYLKQEHSNLFCVEIVCAGVSSPNLFRSYVEEASDGNNSVKAVNFRSKTSGWKDYSVDIIYHNGKHKYFLHQVDNYLRLYKTTLPYRESCFNCHFKKETSESDLTIGDAWGVDPLKDDDLGTSIALVHTKKGQDLLSYISETIFTEPWVGPLQKVLSQSYSIPANYEMFKNEFLEDVSCRKLADKYATISKQKINSLKKQVYIKQILKKLHVYSLIKSIRYK